jgi:hypothetical protein
MSYEEDLWNGYENLNTYFNHKRKTFKDWLHVLTEINKVETEHAKGLKKIYDWNYDISAHGTLGEAVKCLRDYHMSEFQSLQERTNIIKTNIIDPSKKFIEDQILTSKSIHQEAKKVENDYKVSYANMEKAKSKFYQHAKLAEDAKLDSEIGKITYISYAEKEKFNNKANNLLKEAKDAEKQYIISLNYCNAMRLLYIDVCKRVLRTYQQLDEDFTEYCKNILRTNMIFKNALLKNLLFDNDKVSKTVEAIDVKVDSIAYIIDNKTHNQPPSRIEYHPYQIKLLCKPVSESEYPSSAVLNVIKTLTETFDQENSIKFCMETEKKKIQIYDLTKLVCDGGDEFTEEHRVQIYELIKEKNYRLFFLQQLNKKRSLGHFTLDRKCFNLIGDIFVEILKWVKVEKDFECGRYCIILSQTYHYLTKSGKKISLQSKIINNVYLCSVEFWEEFIACIYNF